MEGMVEEKNDTTNQNLHLLKDKWTMWAHLPDDTNWTINSYKNIITLNSLEQSIQFFNIFRAHYRYFPKSPCCSRIKWTWLFVAAAARKEVPGGSAAAPAE